MHSYTDKVAEDQPDKYMYVRLVIMDNSRYRQFLSGKEVFILTRLGSITLVIE